MAYDRAGRAVGDGIRVNDFKSMEFDQAGQLAATGNAVGRTEYVHDPRGRETMLTGTDGTTKRKGYDGVGWLTSRTDEAGRLTGYGYNVGESA